MKFLVLQTYAILSQHFTVLTLSNPFFLYSYFVSVRILLFESTKGPGSSGPGSVSDNGFLPILNTNPESMCTPAHVCMHALMHTQFQHHIQTPMFPFPTEKDHTYFI